MNEQENYSSARSSSAMFFNSDPIKRMFTTEFKHLVIVVPDSMSTEPVDLGWISEHEPYTCRIISLGKCKAHHRLDISNTLYRELLLRLIAAGVKVIHKNLLEETNAKHLERYPDAEGIPIWRPKARKGFE